MYLHGEKKNTNSPFRFTSPFHADDSFLPTRKSLSAIKYVDFSVYILARVPYLVGKQKLASTQEEAHEKRRTWGIINSFCAPDMTMICRS